ncbi:hypothetical protein ERO13_A07G172466v2, partial [Gossypium hirsutum]
MKKSIGTKFPHIKFMLSANPEKVCITDEASISVHIERTTLDISSVNFSSSKDCRETSLRMLILTMNNFHNPKLLSQYV